MKNTKEYREFFVVLILATGMGWIMCPNCMKSWSYAWKMEAIMVTIWMVMWYGNRFVSQLASRYFSWINEPTKRFIAGVIGTTVFSTSAILGLALFFNTIFDISIGNGWGTAWVSIGISLAILLFMQAREFLFSWRNLALRQEKMRSELLEAQYEVLKNQINPHFMFNGLNALSSLVYEDQDMAAKYIDQLAKVLRYVLHSGKHEIVTIHEELEVLASYIFLQKIRFGNNLNVDIEINQDRKENMVAPLVFQMLIENAIKHNEITSDNPLQISIRQEGDYLVVSNNLRLKDAAMQDSTQLGLPNIKARYKTLSNNEVQIEQSTKEFIVKIPILKELK